VRLSRVYRLTLLLVFLYLFVVAAGAKAAGIEDFLPVRAFRGFDRTNAKGLSQSTTTSLVQDEEGVLWIGTFDGLATYDGLSIEPIAPGPEAPFFGTVYSLGTLRGGGICAGTTDGVHLFKNGQWRLLPTHRSVAVVAEGPDARLWIIDTRGVLYVSTRTGEWRRREIPPDAGPAVSIQPTVDGDVWVACRSTVLRFGSLEVPEKLTAAPLGDSISAFCVARDGTCWVGTRSGDIYCASRATRSWKRIEDGAWQGGLIRCLTEDQRGRIWAGGSNGWVKFGTEAGRWTVWSTLNGLRHGAIMSIYADREGTIWFGLNGNGLQQLVGEAWSHRVIWPASGPGAWRATTFSISGTHDGGVLAACLNNGVWYWNGRGLTTFGIEDGLTDDARVAVERQPGTFWVGCRYGLYESIGRRPFRRVLALDDGFVTGIYRSPGGDWYLSTSRDGIFRHVGGRWVREQALNRELSDLNVRHMAWLSNGDLVVATLRGATFYRGGGKVETIAPSFGLVKGLGVNVVLETTPGELWLGGFGGIAVLKGDRTQSFFTAEDGIPGNTIYSLQKGPDGSVWAGGSNGVGRYSHGRWTVFDSTTGLIEDECNLGGLWISPDGDVWVGTMASLARFDRQIQPLPLPRLRTFWRDTPPAGPDGVIRLEPAARRLLSLHWRAPWLAPHRVEYRYRVPRLDAQWSPAQHAGELTVQNLGPGEWYVEVSARLAGVTDWTAPISLRIIAKPRFWERPWAYIAAIGLLPVFVFLIMRWRSGRLARRAVDLQALVDEELASIRVLKGLLPICASCKKIRDDRGYWNQIEAYIRQHSEAEFSHGICPDCAKKLYSDFTPESGEASKQDGSDPGRRPT